MVKKKRHIFWGLMRVFRREYIILGVMLCINVVSSFASPFGIKELLRYVLVIVQTPLVL